MWPTFLAITQLIVFTLPDPGEYRLMFEEIAVTTPKWDPECGPRPKVSKTPKNAILQVTIKDNNWEALGAGRHFGPQTCEGQSQHLKVADHYSKNNIDYVTCFSSRVQAGTEETQHKIWLEEKMARIHIQTTAKQSQRVRRRYRCESVVKHHTVIVSRAALKKKRTRLAELAKTAPEKKPEKKYDHSGKVTSPEPTVRKPSAMEQLVDKELQEQMEQVAYAPVRLVHVHRMSNDFVILSTVYALDQKRLPASRPRPIALGKGEKVLVFDDYLSEGVHTLEVEIKYRGFSRNAPFRVTLRDVYFIDVAEGSKGQVIEIIGYERGSFFTSRRDKPRIRFQVSKYASARSPK